MKKQNLSPAPLRLDCGEHAATALYLIARFGWLRARELGLLIYPKNIHSRKYAEKLLRKLVKLRYVLGRKLPGFNSGTAFVIASRGADWLNYHTENGEEPYKDGTDWGRIEKGTGWYPPASWIHDLIANSVLALSYEMGAEEVIPELQLRKMSPNATKHADGLIITRDKNGEKQSIWLEVERTRKTGKNADWTIEAVLKAERSKPVTEYPNVPPVRHGVIAIPNESIDERGYKINHKERIMNKVKKINLASPITIRFFIMEMNGINVDKFILDETVLKPIKKGNEE